MPLWVASTSTSMPPTNAAVRQAGHGRAGWRRATLMTPHRYKPTETTTTAVTTGANCHCVSTADRLNGGSMLSPFTGEPTGELARCRRGTGTAIVVGGGFA